VARYKAKQHLRCFF